MTQHNVLIVADNAEFARTVIARWQSELMVPAFTVMDGATFAGTSGAGDPLVVCGGMGEEQLDSLLAKKHQNYAVICVLETCAQANSLRKKHPGVLAFAQDEGWAEHMVLLAGETLRRIDAVLRARKLENELKDLQVYATLGQYTAEMKHGLNNALTSVLGNAELLLLEPGRFSAEMREQLDTIHSMSLRMHEILQRFSSLENELKVAEKASHAETLTKSHAAGSSVPNVH